MKKTLFLIFAVVLFASCSKDDDTQTKSTDIAGRWEFSKVYYEVDATSPAVKTEADKDALSNTEHMKGSYLVFSEDGKYTNSLKRWDNINYYTKGNLLYFNEHNHNYWENWQFSLTNNTFTFIFDKTEHYSRKFPEGGVKKVTEYMEYIKSK